MYVYLFSYLYLYYGDRIKCPKQTGLSTVEITISTLDSFIFSDILFCLGSICIVEYTLSKLESLFPFL